MKIKRIQITIEPVPGRPLDSGCKTFTVHVQADGRTFSTMNYFDDDDFQDVFGHLMKDAERSIRGTVAQLQPPDFRP